MPLFRPLTGFPWFPRFAESIEQLFRERLSRPLWLWGASTADLPTTIELGAAEGALGYDMALNALTYFDGSTWLVGVDTSGADFTGEVSATKFSVGSETEQGVDPSFVSKRRIDDSNLLPGMDATPGAHGFSDSNVIDRGPHSGVMAYNSFEARFQVGAPGTPTSRNYDHFNGFQCNPFVWTTGTTTDWRSYQSAPMFWNGTLTNYYGFYQYALDRLPSNYLGASSYATITNAHGIYLEALGRGTNRFAFKSVGADDQVSIAGHTDVQNWIRASGFANQFTAGKGVEIFYNTSADAGGINSYDRSGSVYKPLYIDGSTVTIRVSVTDTVTVSSGALNLESGVVLQANGTQVVTARQTGWGAATGTATRSAIATYTAPTISNPPTQAEVQAIADALQAWSRRGKAMSDDLATHGLIGT